MANDVGAGLMDRNPPMADGLIALSLPDASPATPVVVAAVRFQGGWRIVAEGHCLARLYSDQADAEAAALRQASQLRRSGHVTEVLVHGPNGEMRFL